MREYTTSGEMVKPEQLLVKGGFDVGVYVTRTKKDDKNNDNNDDKDKVEQSGQIKAVTSQYVIVKLQTGADAVINLSEFLSGKWAKFTPKAENKEITWWHNAGHTTSPDIKAMLAKAKLSIAVDKLVKQKAKNWVASCALFGKPRKVKAKRDLAPEELQLVPSSLTLGSNTKDALHKLRCVNKAAVAIEVDNLIVHMNPCRVEPKTDDSKTQQPKESEPKQGETKQAEPKQGETKKEEPKQGETKKEEPKGETKQEEQDGAATKSVHGFIVPFWEVQSTNKPSEANMEFKMMSTVQDGIAVPVMVNFKAVKCGTELKYLDTNFPRVPKSLMQDPKDAEKTDEKEKTDQEAVNKEGKKDEKEPAPKKVRTR